MKNTCNSKEDEIAVNFDGMYIDLIIKQSESYMEIKCRQKRELWNYQVPKISRFDLQSIKKLKIIHCVLGEISFLKNFTDHFNAKNILKADLDFKFKKEMEITSEIFDGLEKATEMKLNAEKHHNLRADSFKKLESLTVLSLYVYDVIEPQIPSDLFTALKKLEILSVVSTAGYKEGKYNKAKNFTLLLNDYMNLKKFSLQGVRWPFDMQLKLPKMVNDITISNNVQLIKLGENEFRRNDQIEVLNLSRNSLEEIHKQAFWPLLNLQKIDLSFNKLSTINATLFVENVYLEYLDLSSNKLETLGL
jgi:hypothetical protein